ncbi:hypothetical protein Tco_1220822 [Tanacetum coccineum]
MVPLFEGRIKRFMLDRKIPHTPTSSSSSSSQSHDSIDSVDNFQLSPITYYNQLLPIPEAQRSSSKPMGCLSVLVISFPTWARRRSEDHKAG